MKQTAIMLSKQASKQASKINYVLNLFCLQYFLSRDAVQQLLHIEILCERRCVNMEKYAKAQMEVIEFEAEDVITTSTVTIPIGCGSDVNCTSNEPPKPDGDGWIWGD